MIMSTKSPADSAYSPVQEAGRIFSLLCDQAERLCLPAEVVANKDAVSFNSAHNQIYYPIPFKETETLAALKGVEGALAAAIADLRYGSSDQKRSVKVNLERATAFGCQAYMAKVAGLSKLDPEVKKKLKGMKIVSCRTKGLPLTYLRRYRFACRTI
jgi:hypothetical protein